MKVWNGIMTVLGLMCSSTSYTSTVFDEDRGWTIRVIENAGTPFACTAQKQIRNVKVSITPALVTDDPYFIFTTSLRADQKLKSQTLDILFDNQEISLPRKQISLNSDTIELLVKFRDLKMEQFGTTDSLQINLSPHTRINLDSPTYAMYLLDECVRTINQTTHETEISAFTQRQFPNLTNRVSATPQAETDPVTDQLEPSEITQQKETKQADLPLTFEQFVKALSMIEKSRIKFLSRDDARSKYESDWIDAGWIGDKRLIYGIGYVTNARSKDVIEYMSDEIESACEKRNGDASSKDIGVHTAGEQRAHVAFTLCRLDDGWMTLSKTAYDMQSKSFGITESILYDSSHEKSLSDWFTNLK